MANTTLQTRIKNKIDSFATWNANNPILLKGEIAIVEMPAGSTDTGGIIPPAILFKIGDGVKNFKDLEWLSAKSADVYSWAKTPTKPAYTADEITGLSDYISEVTTVDTNTSFQLVQDTTDKHKIKLQKQEKGSSTWTDVDTWITIPDNNTTYTFTEGTTNGAFTVTPNGSSAQTVKVHGLGTAAYKADTAFDPAGAASDVQDDLDAYKSANDAAVGKAMPKSGGTFTGTVTLSGDPTSNLQAATKKYVDDKTSGLVGAMHFRGTFESTTACPTPASGDVILVGTKEYVYNGTDWQLYGDEGTYATQAQLKDHTDNKVAHITAAERTSWNGKATMSEVEAKGYQTATQVKAIKVNNAGNADTVGGHTVGIDVPADAVFTDTGITAVTANDGLSKSITGRTLTLGINSIAAAKVTDLAKVATSGKIDDLTQTNYVIFDCGTSNTVI